MKRRLLIVDDDEEIRTQMKWALNQDYDVLLAEDKFTGVESFKANAPSVVLLDLGLPPHPNDPEEGLATLQGILDADRLAKVIIISGQGEKENALRAVGVGAYVRKDTSRPPLVVTNRSTNGTRACAASTRSVASRPSDHPGSSSRTAVPNAA